MPQAARIGDEISHGGSIVSGSENVVVEGSPQARLGDAVMCDIHDEQVIVTGSSTVFVNGRPAARVGDSISCDAVISTGAARTFIGG